MIIYKHRTFPIFICVVYRIRHMLAHSTFSPHIFLARKLHASIAFSSLPRPPYPHFLLTPLPPFIAAFPGVWATWGSPVDTRSMVARACHFAFSHVLPFPSIGTVPSTRIAFGISLLLLMWVAGVLHVGFLPHTTPTTFARSMQGARSIVGAGWRWLGLLCAR